MLWMCFYKSLNGWDDVAVPNRFSQYSISHVVLHRRKRAGQIKFHRDEEKKKQQPAQNQRKYAPAESWAQEYRGKTSTDKAAAKEREGERQCTEQKAKKMTKTMEHKRF